MKMYNIERNWKAIWEYSHEENPNRDCLTYIKDINYINFSKLRKDLTFPLEYRLAKVLLTMNKVQEYTGFNF